jgi:hypothetical protein
MTPSLDSVFTQQQHQQQQAAREVPQHQFLGQAPQQPYRNGFGVHDAAELVPAGKLEGNGFL